MQFRSVHDLIDDQIDVITRGLMGVTVACARCHDHKFDEIPTTDYYALYATLASSESPDDLPVLGEPSPTDQLREYQRQLEQRQTIYRDMARDQTEVMRNRLRSQVGLYLTDLGQGCSRTRPVGGVLVVSHRRCAARCPASLASLFEHAQRTGSGVLCLGPPAGYARGSIPSRVRAIGADAESRKRRSGPVQRCAQHERRSAEMEPTSISTLEEAKPASLIELAEAYGKLFSDVHLGWLKALQDASLEATPAAEIITDEDPRHAEINSAINQQLRRHLYETGTPTAVPDEVAAKLLNRTVSDKLSGKRGTIHDLHLNSPGSPPRGMVLAESETPPEYRVFLRGNPLSRGERGRSEIFDGRASLRHDALYRWTPPPRVGRSHHRSREPADAPCDRQLDLAAPFRVGLGADAG